jgi:hypothetical protein
VNRNHRYVSTTHVRLPSASSSRRSAARHGALTEKFAHLLGDESAEIFHSEVAGIN